MPALRLKKFLAADKGEPGRTKEQYGKNAEDLVLNVPVGTIVRDIESGHALTTDGDYVYVTGQFLGSASYFGGTPYTSSGGSEIFVTRLACSNGAFGWFTQAGSTSLDVGSCIDMGESGYLYTSGNCSFNNHSSTFSSGGGTIYTSTNPGYWGGYVAKMDKSNGYWVWVNDLIVNSAKSCGIVIDYDPVSQEVFGYGYSEGYCLVDGQGYASIVNTTGLADCFLTAFDQTGNYVWAYPNRTVQYGGASGNEYPEAIKVSGSTIYALGIYSGTTDFGGSPYIHTSAGSTDATIGRFDLSGAILSYESGGGSNGDALVDLAMDAQGNAYATGQFNTAATYGGVSASGTGDDPILLKYGSTSTLDFQWAKTGAGSGTDVARGVTIDKDGYIYEVGFFENTVDFGNSVTLASAGGSDIFLVKYNCKHQAIWAHNIGGSGNENNVWSAADVTTAVVTAVVIVVSAPQGRYNVLNYGEAVIIDHNNLPRRIRSVRVISYRKRLTGWVNRIGLHSQNGV